jgi:hypothetical protein
LAHSAGWKMSTILLTLNDNVLAITRCSRDGWQRRLVATVRMAMALLGVSVIVGTLVGVNFTSYG